jgi:hypothetical protein
VAVQLGTKLLGTDVRIAARLIWKTMRGKTLSRYPPPPPLAPSPSISIWDGILTARLLKQGSSGRLVMSRFNGLNLKAGDKIWSWNLSALEVRAQGRT